MFLVTGLSKIKFFFLILTFSPLLEKKIEILIYFFRNLFTVKKSEDLSSYSNYENLRLTNTKVTINAVENAAKNFETFLRVLC